jgi:hypothetical protein
MRHAYMREETVVQRFSAKNDVNGNPRRVWVIYYPGSPPLAIDEGYEGVPSQITSLMEYVEFPTVRVEPAEYRRLLKDYGVTKLHNPPVR